MLGSNIYIYYFISILLLTVTPAPAKRFRGCSADVQKKMIVKVNNIKLKKKKKNYQILAERLAEHLDRNFKEHKEVKFWTCSTNVNT